MRARVYKEMDPGSTESDQWREIAAQKEREWKEVTDQRIRTLETSCKDKEKQLCEEKAKFQKLKDDFKYNLRLLAERDQELERYDASFADVKAQLNAKTAEVSECKIHVDEMKTKLNCEAKSREELQLHYQARLREKQAEIDSYRCTKDGEIQEERKEFESFKRKLERKLKEVEEEMDMQKREISAGFEEAMKKREHEFRVQSDEMSAKNLEYELKAKLLSKELDLVRDAQAKNSKEFEMVESNHVALEKKWKEKDWELQDLRAMTDAQISDLQNQIRQKESAMKRHQEEYERKHAEIDKYCREKEAALGNAKESFSDRESELQNVIRELQSKLEEGQVEIRRCQWANQDLEKEKASCVQKFQEQTDQLREKWDKQLAELSRDQVSKDLELQAIRETEDKLRLELIQKKDDIERETENKLRLDLIQKKIDIERYKKELGLATEREDSLERSKAQMELDWQRRYEDLERQQYERSEDFIKRLTKARDEALATVKEKDRELQHRTTLIRALQTDRDQAMVTLKKHGIKLDKNVNIELAKAAMSSTDDVSSLQQQNDNLRAVIKEMRAQMEELGHEIPDVNLQPQRGDNITEGYVKGLEKEVKDLRKKNRELEQDADVARRFGRHAKAQPENQEEVLSEVKDNALVKNHIQSLNDQLGSLKAEKVELCAQVKKHQAHIQYQEKAAEKAAREHREQQVQLDQLQYELGAANRRGQAQVASLRQRNSELELQLLEARKEADEYYKGNLERNMEATGLQQELASLKMDLAQKRPAINFGAQELLIQQLQDEIKNLKQRGMDLSLEMDSVASGDASSQVRNLQQKLRNAARKIMELAKERQQLIEMGNKLRTELKKAGLGHPSSVYSGTRIPPPSYAPPREVSSGHMTSFQPLSENYSSKLGQLEKLQYQLTRQELQYAQRYQETNGDDTGSDRDEDRPPSILKKPSGVRDSMDTEIDVRASVNTEGGETLFSARSVPTARSQLLMSMSSMGGESLQEIWKMLDDGRPSPTPRSSSPLRAQKAVRLQSPENLVSSQESAISDSKDLQIAGHQTGRSRGKPEKKYSDRVAGRVPKKVQQKQAVRNYNVRDDAKVR